MFAIERHNKIREKLMHDKRVDVVELSELFSVTEVTIRRDLDKLEQEGFLIKTYGGAVLSEDLSNTAVVPDLDDKVLREKRMIGKMAAHMIEPGEAIFLSPGGIGLEIAKQIKGKRVTVITNDVLIAAELRDAAGVRVIVTGGDLLPSSSALVGEFVQKSLTGIHINKAFSEVSGVHLEAGYTMDSREESMVLSHVRSISNEFLIVADYTRFSSMAFSRLGELDIAAKVITNKQVPAAFKQYFFEHAIKIYTAYEFE